MKPRLVLHKLLEGFRSLVIGQSGESPSADENRASPRILCDYRVQLTGPETFTATVVDIGTTGLRVKGVPELQKGEVFSISYPYGGESGPKAAFEVECMWCRAAGQEADLVAGFRFLKQGSALKGTWVYTLLSELGLSGNAVFQKRKHLRLSTRRKVLLRDAETGRHLLSGRLNNLSVGGALVQSAFELEKDRRVLTLVGGSPEQPSLKIQSQVIDTRMDDEDGHRLISLRFVELSEEQLGQLEELILEMLKERTL